MDEFHVVEQNLDRYHRVWTFYPNNIEAEPIIVCLRSNLTINDEGMNNCPHCGDSLVNCWKRMELLGSKSYE